jgi:hypothetical protein
MGASSIAVLKTLTYADIFDYPLTREEIWRWLISDKGKAEKTLQGLIKKGTIAQKEGYFFFKGREEVVGARKKREEWAKEKWVIAQKTAAKLRKIPGIRLLGVTGALAVNNCKKEDDIDFLVITSAGYLWLVRLVVYLLAPALGIKRRRPAERKVKDKICFNLFLDEGSLRVGPPSLFLAHEVAQLKPLVNKGKAYERFLWENQWVGDFLPNAKNNSKFKVQSFDRLKIDPEQSRMDQSSKLERKHLISQCLSILISFLDTFAFKIQYLFMKPKITNEKVSLHQAFFHPKDLSDKIQKEFERRIKSLEGKIRP